MGLSFAAAAGFFSFGNATAYSAAVTGRASTKNHGVPSGLVTSTMPSGGVGRGGAGRASIGGGPASTTTAEPLPVPPASAFLLLLVRYMTRPTTNTITASAVSAQSQP